MTPEEMAALQAERLLAMAAAQREADRLAGEAQAEALLAALDEARRNGGA